MINIKNLTVSFGDQIILNNLSLSVPKNEITVVAGQSGSGKTVLMKTIEGLIIPDKGLIQIDELPITGSSKRDVYKIRRRISMLFQGSALLDSLNVFQNIALPLSEQSQKTEAEIAFLVQQKLDLVGLPDVMKKMPSELSGGMKKRVGLARAIITEPDYIIYDEPTTGLDPIISEEIIDLMLVLQRDLNITSLIITHDLDCIKKTADNLVFLGGGKILYDGKFRDFKNKKCNALNMFFRNIF